MHSLPPIDIKKLKRKRRTDPLEKVIEKKVCDYAQAHGISQEKYVTPQRRSVPDRIFFPGGGQCFFIEFKRRGKKPTPGQLKDHAARRQAGYLVFVVDNVDDGKKVINECLLVFK